MFVTPQYLTSHGFEHLQSHKDTGLYAPPEKMDRELYFCEKSRNRNCFIVTLERHDDEIHHPSTDSGFHHTIYVQDDAGCGFVRIPERWSALSIKHFEAIYFGINGVRPKP